MKRKLGIMAGLLAVNLVFSGCSINPFKESDTEASAETTSEQKSKEGENIDVVGAGAPKKAQIENQFMTERKTLDNARENNSKAYIDTFDNDIKTKDSEKQKLYNEKTSQNNSAVKNVLRKELEIDLKRISDEYNSEKSRIEAEYKAEVAKNKITSQNSSSVSSAEKNRAEQLYNAEKEKAEKEMAAKNKNAAKIAEQAKKEEAINKSYNNIWEDYNKKVALAVSERESNKKSFKEKVNKQYDEKLQNLIDDNILNDTIWSNTIVSEDKEITNYYNEQDENYKKRIQELIKLRDEQLTRM